MLETLTNKFKSPLTGIPIFIVLVGIFWLHNLKLSTSLDQQHLEQEEIVLMTALKADIAVNTQLIAAKWFQFLKLWYHQSLLLSFGNDIFGSSRGSGGRSEMAQREFEDSQEAMWSLCTERAEEKINTNQFLVSALNLDIFDSSYLETIRPDAHLAVYYYRHQHEMSPAERNRTMELIKK